MNGSELTPACQETAALLLFYVYDELNARERTRIEQHLASCTDCQKQLLAELDLRNALSSVQQPADRLDSAGILLAQCRSKLAEELDDLLHPRIGERVTAFGWLRGWMALHPAWAGALLVLFGLLAGAESMRWAMSRNDAAALEHAVSVRPGPRFTEEQLSKLAVAGVNFAPSQDNTSQNVRMQLSAEQPLELTGSLDDADVRNVLTYVVKNGQRFDPGLRLDCLDALQVRADDAEVRSALLCAARKDQNPAIRLKAFEALHKSASDRAVREALLQALENDSNPGVRVEAVNLLVRSIEQTDFANTEEMRLKSGKQATLSASSDESLAKVIHALENLQRNDPSRYVRLRSAGALRQISESDDQ